MIVASTFFALLSARQDHVKPPTLPGFKLGQRVVKEFPENGGYQVFQKGGKLKVLTRVEWVRQQRAKPRFHAPKGSVNVKESGYRATFVPGAGIKVVEGELYDVDIGEWGGGIYFVSNSRKTATKISSRNTEILEQFADGIYAFQSLHHMMFFYAELVKVDFVGGKWVVRTVLSLKEAPNSVNRDGDRFVLLMDKALLAIYPDGKQRELFNLGSIKNHYWCMTILSNHQIWLGGDAGVAAFVPRLDGTYEHFSYIPTKP